MKQKTSRMVCGLGAIIAGLAPIVGGIAYSARVKSIEQRARESAMQHYEPIGNGGAIAYNLSGKISSNRKEMYTRMQKAYEQTMREHNLYNTDRDPYLRFIE